MPGIAIAGRPTGQMGNRLFQFHFLRQVAVELDVAYAYPSVPERQIFCDMDTQPYPVRHVPGKRKRLAPAEVDARDPYTALLNLREVLSSGRWALLPQSLLGNHFFDYCFRPPKEVVRLRAPLPAVGPQIGVHLRGGDFRKWDGRAILPASYYIDAVEWCLDDAPSARISVFTDDDSLEAAKDVRAHFADRLTLPTSGHPFADFRGLASSSHIVSSPSTFAIWAGILSTDSRIVHSKRWVELKAEEGDFFWETVAHGGSRAYVVDFLA